MKRSSNSDTNTDRYLAIVGWARKRYTDSKGLLVLSKGSQLSVYSRIEQAAWRKYKA